MSNRRSKSPFIAKQVADRSKARSDRISKAATALLLVTVCILGVVLLLFQRKTDALRLPSHSAASDSSPGLAFDKISLDEQKSAIRIGNVQVVDFDREGLNDVLVCDVARNAVVLYRQTPGGKFEERVIADNLKCPAHATLVDLDSDGDMDVVVAVLGNITPSDELVGKVVLLENEGGHFTRHVLLDDIRRVADVQAGDFNGDGAMDLAVGVFGYARGEVLWLENRGKKDGQWHFRDHQLLDRPGAIHVPVADFDGDGRPDIAVIISQDEEELWAFQNLGGGEFKPRKVYESHNYDVGGAGLVLCDLDKDGRPDLLMPQGDNLENAHYWPQPYHGCLWFKNLGDWNFAPKQIAHYGGTYAAAAGDLDGDSDMDVVLVSLCNDWGDLARPSIVWLENDGQQDFRMRSIGTTPIGLITVACGDLNKDGRADIVAGALMLPPIIERRMQPVTAWISKKSQ